ncbi:MAG: TIR domain-containing protein, partial [Polyangiaceae bacterium]
MGSADTKGRITTFYSYKGGTGRTMALANVAWVLAAAGRRVLTVDWDLEAPGLNRYFAPFLDDPECKRSEGLLDWIYEYLVALTQPHACPEDPDWAEPYAALDGYANSLKWQFPGEGCLHFIAAGQQSSGYAERVNKLDWFRLYTEHGGKAFVETAFRQARERYDDILIDSRTGVADTSGICTIQLPDQLVAAYTLNNQSIEGCSEVARNAALSRDAERRPLTVLPVATRVEFAEDDRLKRRQVLARSRFEQFVPERDRGSYFGRQQLPYVPFYAYEEVLATIRERPDSGHPLLLGFVALAREVAGRDIESLPDISPAKRDAALLRYAATSGAESATVGVQPNSEGVTPPTGTAPKEASKAWDVFVSYPMDRTDAAEALHRQLSARATAFIASRSIPVGANRDETVKRACESAAVHVFVIGPQSPIPNGWYASELEQALDRARRTGSPKIVPVIVDGAPFDRARYPQLQEFQALKMNSGGERAAAEAILDALGVVPARSHELERERAVSAEVRLEQLSVSSRRASQIWLAAAILSSVGVVAAGLWQHGQSVADRQKLIDSANALQRQKDDSVRVIKSTKEQGLTDVFKAQ